MMAVYLLQINISHFLTRFCRMKLRRYLSNETLYPKDVLNSLTKRGLVKQIFPDNEKIECTGIPCAYAGFDATADSLHVGNLLVLVALLHWQRAGFDTIAIIGDKTAQLGDPTGHKTDRKSLSEDIVVRNANSIKKNLETIFQNHQEFLLPKHHVSNICLGSFRILKNSDWYERMTVKEFFENVFLIAGLHIRVGNMLSRTSVKLRMDSNEGINFKEFSYQLFQSYDWLHLCTTYNSTFQFGGIDQLGNISTGYNLITSFLNQDVYGVLSPLIKSETGDKFGKSSGNAVYLSSERTPPFDLYQFFMRLPDSDLSNFLHLFTFYTLDEIDEILQNHKQKPESRIGQEKLAEEVTLLVHGEHGLSLAKAATKILFHSDLHTLSTLDVKYLNQIFPNLSEIKLDPSSSILDLTLQIGCFLTKNDAKRVIKEGGCYLNFKRISSPDSKIVPDQHILPNNTSLLRIGKRNYYLIHWIES